MFFVYFNKFELDTDYIYSINLNYFKYPMVRNFHNFVYTYIDIFE